MYRWIGQARRQASKGLVVGRGRIVGGIGKDGKGDGDVANGFLSKEGADGELRRCE